MFLLFWGAAALFVVLLRICCSPQSDNVFRCLLHGQLLLKLLFVICISALYACKLWDVQRVTIDPGNDMTIGELIKEMEDYEEGLLDGREDFIFDL